MTIKFVKRTDNSNNNKKLDNKTALKMLYDEPQILHVKKVNELRPSKIAENSYYFFVDLQMEDGQEFGISYTVQLNEYDEIWCSNGSKLFALLKGFLNINSFDYKGISLTMDDITETLSNKTFLAKCEAHTYGGKIHLYLVSEEEVIL